MTQNINTAKQWVKESDAEMLTFRVITFSGVEEILRGWPASKIPKDKLEICKAYLISRGSEKNNKQSWTIKDPQVDKEDWFGTWQHFDEGWQIFNRQLYLTQTIRLGFYQDIPYQSSEVSSDRTVSTRQQLGLTTEISEPMAQVAGQIKSQNVRLNKENGSKDIHTNKDVGIAETNVTTARAPDATAVTTEKTVQSAALTASTPTAGTIRRIINAISKYYERYTTTETVETGIAQTSTEKIKTGFLTSTVEEKTVQAAELPDPTAPTLAAPGTIVSIINRVSKYFNRWTTRKKTDTTRHVSVPEFKMYDNGLGKVVYQSEEIHDTVPPDVTKYKPTGWTSGAASDVAAANEASILSHSLDDYLTHSYKKTRTVRTLASYSDDGVTWTEYGDTETISTQKMSVWLSPNRLYIEYKYVYQTLYTYTIKYFNNATAAAAYAATATTTDLPEDPTARNLSGAKTKFDDNSRGGFVQTGEKEWRATKVIMTKSLRGTYYYYEPDE